MENLKIVIISARFNEKITSHLHCQVKKTLLENGIKESNILEETVPGAFELPLMAKTIAENSDVDAIITLGAVIKGATAHFEYVAKGMTEGIMRAGLDTNVPIIYGVLTTYNEEQAMERAITQNIGADFAFNAIELANKRKKWCYSPI